MNKKTVLILGATSTIAMATAKTFAERGYALLLAGRRMAELQHISSDLQIRYRAQVTCYAFDAADFNSHTHFATQVMNDNPELTGIVLCFGYLGDQALAQQSPDEIQKILHQNYTGAASILECFAPFFEKNKQGWMMVISSVAGDRGRQSNYHYGAAKAALNVFLQGLRHRLSKNNIRVITIKPGFIDTPMTYGLTHSILMTDPADLADAILNAIQKNKSEIYYPAFWKYIMFIIKYLPQWVFHRTSL